MANSVIKNNKYSPNSVISELKKCSHRIKVIATELTK